MHRRASRRAITVGVLAWASLFSAGLTAHAPKDQDKPVAPDNTRVNKRDRNRSEPTAGQTKENASDRNIVQRIRQAVMADSSLSSYAHNVKIISQHGKVTLKGPVRSEEERKSVEAKAVEVAGNGNVINRLTVKSETSGSRRKHSKQT